MNRDATQEFKQFATESLESAGNAKNKKGETQNIVIGSLGEIKLVTASESTYQKWVTVFKRYQDLQLYCPDTKQLLKDKRDEKGKQEVYPLLEITSTFLRPLCGLDDTQLGELADHILAKDPKVYLGIAKPQFPKKWTRAQRMATWVRRKKHKSVIIRIVLDHVQKRKKSKLARALKTDISLTEKWRLAKKYLSVSTFHVDYALRMAKEPWLNSAITNGKKAGELPEQAANVVAMMLDNRERWKICRRAADHTLRAWKSDSQEFSKNDFCWRGSKLYKYIGGPATVEYAEVGIMDFRMLPPLGDDVSLKNAFDTYLRELKDLVGARWDGIATWMFIHSGATQTLVLDVVEKFFPDNPEGTLVQYIAGKGEPEKNLKEDVWILYNQASERDPAMCAHVLGENEQPSDVPKLIEREKEVCPLDDTADKVETYRSDHRHYMAKCELRTEVYMHFIDKYCRPGGTALLFFCGLKALAACAVSALFFSRRPSRL